MKAVLKIGLKTRKTALSAKDGLPDQFWFSFGIISGAALKGGDPQVQDAVRTVMKILVERYPADMWPLQKYLPVAGKAQTQIPVRIRCNQFRRWIVIHPTIDMMAWSGSDWVFIDGSGSPACDVQVSNFDTSAEACIYATECGFIVDPSR